MVREAAPALLDIGPESRSPAAHGSNTVEGKGLTVCFHLAEGF